MSFLILLLCMLSFTARVFATPNPVVEHQTGGLDPNGIPPQCLPGCVTIINGANACNRNLTCICTIAKGNLLRTCVNCVVASNYTIAHQAEGQSELDIFYNACTRAGHAVPHLSVSISIATSTTASGTSPSQIPPATVTGDGSGGGGGANMGTSTAGGVTSTTEPLGLTGVDVRNVGTMSGLVMIVVVGVATWPFLIWLEQPGLGLGFEITCAC